MRFIDKHFRSDIYIRFAKTFEVFGDLTGKTVVDIGCGSGVYAIEALRLGAQRVVALDPAPGMLDLVRTRLKETQLLDRCELILGAFPEVMPPQGDHAIVMGVLDYVKDAGAFLRSLRKVVRTSAAVSFPSKHWLRTPLRKVRYRMRNCPLYFYDVPQIKALGREAGFASVEVYKIPGAGMDYHVALRL
ncbi:MAG: class I SAM-dependent methyltransferase [Planctomycetaceae bacterium]|nr:class I SAM-dependent methyltransferase [Planctomycetaceae bacterium]